MWPFDRFLEAQHAAGSTSLISAKFINEDCERRQSSLSPTPAAPRCRASSSLTLTTPLHDPYDLRAHRHSPSHHPALMAVYTERHDHPSISPTLPASFPTPWVEVSRHALLSSVRLSRGSCLSTGCRWRAGRTSCQSQRSYCHPRRACRVLAQRPQRHTQAQEEANPSESAGRACGVKQR